ncbi:MAG: hypothetical protein WAP37_01360 [Solirubrobacterales bacterium]
MTVIVVAFAAFAALFPAFASASIAPTTTATYGSNVPGAHADYSVQLDFTYTPGPATSEDLRKWAIDGPAGLIGNPNAIPFADRCTTAQFGSNPGLPDACPATSRVGAAGVAVTTDALSGTIPAGTPLPEQPGTIYLVQDSTEVPVRLASIIPLTDAQGFVCGSPGCTYYSRSISDLSPLTTGDFRIRAIPEENSDATPPFVSGPTGGGFAAGPTPAHIHLIRYTLFAYADNNPANPPFLTNPTRCDAWNTYSYSTSSTDNTNADSNVDPLFPNMHKVSNTDAATPNCATKPAFAPTVTTTLSTTARDSNPQLDVVTSNGAPGVDLPKTIVNTLPASITTDIQGIGNLCEEPNITAGTCPANTKVGTVKIDTPLIGAGLSGDVFITRSSDAIPDLLVMVTGAVSFRLTGTTRFVGARANQIETTFDNLPQVPLSKFTLTIAGGTDTLLTISKCPDGSTSPEDGPISYSLTSWGGQSAAAASVPALADCFGVAKLKKLRKCVKSRLRVSPSYSSRSGLMKSELWIKNKKTKKYKRVKRVKKSPFRFGVTLSSRKYKNGTYAYKVRAVYRATPANPSPKVLQKYSRFKKC